MIIHKQFCPFYIAKQGSAYKERKAGKENDAVKLKALFEAIGGEPGQEVSKTSRPHKAYVSTYGESLSNQRCETIAVLQRSHNW